MRIRYLFGILLAIGLLAIGCGSTKRVTATEMSRLKPDQQIHHVSYPLKIASVTTAKGETIRFDSANGMYDARSRTFFGTASGVNQVIEARNADSVAALAGHTIKPFLLALDIAAFEKWVNLAPRVTYGDHTLTPGRQFVLTQKSGRWDASNGSIVGLSRGQQVTIPADSLLFVSKPNAKKAAWGVGIVTGAFVVVAVLLETTGFCQGFEDW